MASVTRFRNADSLAYGSGLGGGIPLAAPAQSTPRSTPAQRRCRRVVTIGIPGIVFLLASVASARERCTSFSALWERVPPHTDPKLAASGSKNAWAMWYRREPLGPVVQRWDGCTWREQAIPAAVPLIGTALWAGAAGDVWLAAADGLSGSKPEIFRWDGRAWRDIGAGDLRGTVEAIWSDGRSEAWILGQGAASDGYRSHLLHWDGKALTEPSPARAVRLHALWGASPTDVWVAGEGSVGRWDGRQWTWSRPYPEADVRALAGRGPNDVWALGNTALHFDGRRWARHSVPAEQPKQLWQAGGRLFASAGHALYRLEKDLWLPLLAVRPPGVLRGVEVLAASEAWAVLDLAGVRSPVRWDGRSWQGLPAAGDDVVSLFWQASTGLWSAVAARVGDSGRGFGEVRGFMGGAWRSVTRLGAFPTRVWASGPDDLWVVGSAGASWRWDGRAWHSVPTGIGEELLALWGSNPTDVWAAGQGGALLRWNGREWRRWSILDNAIPPALRGLWGSRPDDVWAVGSNGIYHWDGRGWSRAQGHHTIDNNGPGSFMAVWGSGSGDVWAVGTGGDAVAPSVDSEVAPTPLILHWDGKTWSRPATPAVDPSAGPLLGVWGRARNDVWAVGRGGTLVHFDGQAWRSVPAGTHADLVDVRLDGAGTLWLASTEALLHRAWPPTTR